MKNLQVRSLNNGNIKIEFYGTFRKKYSVTVNLEDAIELLNTFKGIRQYIYADLNIKSFVDDDKKMIDACLYIKRVYLDLEVTLYNNSINEVIFSKKIGKRELQKMISELELHIIKHTRYDMY